MAKPEVIYEVTLNIVGLKVQIPEEFSFKI